MEDSFVSDSVNCDSLHGEIIERSLVNLYERQVGLETSAEGSFPKCKSWDPVFLLLV